MSETTKIWDTWDSTPLSNVAYKRSWREKLRPTTPDLDQDPLARSKTGDAEAAELVNDFRPLRGALSRVIDNLCSFGSSPIMGSCRSPLSERKENKNRITLRENLVPH